jgi:acyl-CoA synthetase (AMP-forming)/AMP-acid ligase II
MGPSAVLRQGQVGHLQVRGAMVMSGYFGNAQANAACLLPDGWLETGDLAFLDRGRLVLAGRAKELVIIRGANFYCHELEEAVGGVAGVATARAAATSVRDEAQGTEVLIVFFVPSDPTATAALPHLHGDGILIEALRRSALGRRGTEWFRLTP